MAGLIQAFKGLSGGQGTVPDHRHHLGRLAFQILGYGDPQGRGDGRTAVAGIKGIVRTFLPLGKAAHPPVGSQGREKSNPAGQQLMGITLVAHVPDDFILGAVEDVMKGQGQLHDAQIRGQMAAVTGDGFNDQGADFLGQLPQLGQGKAFQVLRTGEGGQYPGGPPGFIRGSCIMFHIG